MQKLPEGDTPHVNEYYARISKKLRNMRYLMLLLMVLALVFTLWAYRNRLTYDNFRYLLRDMDEAGNTVVSTDSVYYTASDTNNYMFFRGDLAVACADGVELHRALGNRSFEDAVSFRAPSLCGSEKYMIAYDTGGNTFYVYNSISRVYSETLDREIIDCAAADNGSFAVLTKNNIGGSIVRLYDKNFRLTGEITREEYAYSVEYFDDGRLGISLCVSDGISLYTDFLTYTHGSEDIDSTVRVGGLVMLSGKTDEGYYLLSDLGLAFFNDDGERTSYHSFGTATVMYADAAESTVCVLLDENRIGAECGLYIFSADGMSYSSFVENGAKGVSLVGDAGCVLYDGKLIVVQAGVKTEIEVPAGGKKLFGMDKNSVIICYNDYAKIFEVR